jgi:hypothetical protein
VPPADYTNQRDHWSGAKKTYLHARSGESSSGFGDGQIARGDKLASSGRCDPIYLGYYGLRQLVELEHHFITPGEDFLQFAQAFMLARHFPNVVSGAECRAVGSNDENGYLGIFFNLIEGVSDRVDHLQ